MEEVMAELGISKPHLEIDKAWLDESERRYAEYRAGKLKGIPDELIL